MVGVRDAGVSLYPERETTQTMVKAPKCWISLRKSLVPDNGKVGLEAATLERVRNSSPIEVKGTENGRD